MGLDVALVLAAVVTAAASVIFFALDSLPDMPGVALTVVSATVTAFVVVRRWLPPRADLIDQAYMCGWADCARSQLPYPAPSSSGAVVRPLRPVRP